MWATRPTLISFSLFVGFCAILVEGSKKKEERSPLQAIEVVKTIKWIIEQVTPAMKHMIFARASISRIREAGRSGGQGAAALFQATHDW
jgi:hypothetical protein